MIEIMLVWKFCFSGFKIENDWIVYIVLIFSIQISYIHFCAHLEFVNIELFILYYFEAL